MYQATPNKYKEDINYKFHVSITDFDLLQFYNLDIQKTYTGVLDTMIRNLFMRKRIVPFLGFPDSTVVGARTTSGPDSNFVYAMYFSLDAEFQGIQIEKTAILGKEYGFRVDVMSDTQYRAGEDIVFYEGT